MVVYGYAKTYQYDGNGMLQIQVRIPNIHGPFVQDVAHPRANKTYVSDGDLPFYHSVLLPYLPSDGDVVALMPTNEKNNSFYVIGLTGGSYAQGLTDL